MKKFIIALCLLLVIGCNKEEKKPSLVGTAWAEQTGKDYYNMISFDTESVCRLYFVASNGNKELDATGQYSYANDRVEFTMQTGKDLFGIITTYQYATVSGSIMTVYYQYGTNTLHEATYIKK